MDLQSKSRIKSNSAYLNAKLQEKYVALKVESTMTGVGERFNTLVISRPYRNKVFVYKHIFKIKAVGTYFSKATGLNKSVECLITMRHR